MRSYPYLLLASAALLGLASCSGDEPLGSIGSDTETFTVSAGNPTVTGGYFSNNLKYNNMTETWTPAPGYVITPLNPAHTETIDGTDYTFNYLVEAQ